MKKKKLFILSTKRFGSSLKFNIFWLILLFILFFLYIKPQDLFGFAYLILAPIIIIGITFLTDYCKFHELSLTTKKLTLKKDNFFGTQVITKEYLTHDIVNVQVFSYFIICSGIKIDFKNQPSQKIMLTKIQRFISQKISIFDNLKMGNSDLELKYLELTTRTVRQKPISRFVRDNLLSCLPHIKKNS